VRQRLMLNRDQIPATKSKKKPVEESTPILDEIARTEAVETAAVEAAAADNHLPPLIAGRTGEEDIPPEGELEIDLFRLAQPAEQTFPTNEEKDSLNSARKPTKQTPPSTLPAKLASASSVASSDTGSRTTSVDAKGKKKSKGVMRMFSFGRRNKQQEWVG